MDGQKPRRKVLRAVGDEIGISLLRTSEAFVGGGCVCEYGCGRRGS